MLYLALFPLARAYYLSSTIEPENLARAEATLQELLSSVDVSLSRVCSLLSSGSLINVHLLIFQADPEHQQLRWMRLAVLKKQKAPDPLLEQGLVRLDLQSNWPLIVRL